jgi:hypothetical protein
MDPELRRLGYDSAEPALYQQHAKSKPSTNKDGTPRANSKQQRIAEDIAARE